VIEVSWSHCEGQDCIRVAGAVRGAAVQVRPAAAAKFSAAPPTAGHLVSDGTDLCFLPRFAFPDGTTYTVTIDGVPTANLVRPRPERATSAEVLAIYPTASEVPRNLLRLYVCFSAPMSEGYAAGHVQLLDDVSHVMRGALLPTEHELWDAARRRLTILLDPARIKRGLAPHRQAGYALQRGDSFRLVVDAGFRDAAGTRLRTGAERRYQVGDDQRCRVEPRRWALRVSPGDASGPLHVIFERPLDHGLLARCLHVLGPDRRPVEGLAETGTEERSWRWTPRQAWAPGPHQLVVDPILEDLAGNSVSRVFDRDLTRREDDPRQSQAVTLKFRPR
jgi:hypothetical protein